MVFDEVSLQDELDELDERDRMNMVLVEDMLEIWGIVFSEPLPEWITCEIKKLTEESLKLYWGDGAWVDVDGGYVYLKHEDGRSIERFLAF